MAGHQVNSGESGLAPATGRGTTMVHIRNDVLECSSVRSCMCMLVLAEEGKTKTNQPKFGELHAVNRKGFAPKLPPYAPPKLLPWEINAENAVLIWHGDRAKD